MTSPRKHQKYSRNRAVGTIAACKPANGVFTTDAPHIEGGDFIDQTISIWQKRTERKLTREDGREIVENMSGFFRILQEWDRVERPKRAAKKSPA